MTIEELIRALQPFYGEWNADGDRLYLRAVRGPIVVYADIQGPNGGEIGVQSKAPEGWTLGIDTTQFRERSTIEIAQVEVDGDEKVKAIRPHQIAQYQHLAPLMKAVATSADIRPLIEP